MSSSSSTEKQSCQRYHPSKGVLVIGPGRLAKVIVPKLNCLSITVICYEKNDDEKGMEFHTRSDTESFASMVGRSDLVVSCLDSIEGIKDLILDPVTGLLATLNKSSSYIEMGFISQTAAVKMSKLLSIKGTKFMEAVFIGREDKVRQGNASVLCSGSNILYLSVKDILDSVGKSKYIGSVGTAGFINMAITSIRGAVFQMLNELFSLCEANDIDPMVLYRVLFEEILFGPPYLTVCRFLADELKFPDHLFSFQQTCQALDSVSRTANGTAAPLLSSVAKTYKSLPEPPLKQGSA